MIHDMMVNIHDELKKYFKQQVREDEPPNPF